MRLAVLSCVLSVVSLGVAQGRSGKPLTPFEQQVITAQKQFLQANIDKNAAQVNQTVSEDFMGIGDNGDSYDREEIISSALEGLPKNTYSYDFRVVQLDPASAVVAYDLIVPGGHPRYRHLSNTWTKIDGRWRLKFQQITPNVWSANDAD